MHKYYIDPISGEKADNEEALLSRYKGTGRYIGYITYILEDEGITIEIVKDEDMNSIFINIYSDKMIDKKIKDNIVSAIPSALSTVSRYGATTSTVHITIGKVNRLPLLHIEELAERVLKNTR